ncbi:MAG: hypothetical protein QGI08_14075 [Paracoccaceae bacterium]|nr:hypothetical protein [Paracoccaceae bacterium]MDP7186844.1 hypothetical protein [Paracoccaceae bacterium]
MAEVLNEIARIELPYRRRAIVKEVIFDSGMRMTRLVIKEGTRITQVDLDEETALELGTQLVQSARKGQS